MSDTHEHLEHAEHAQHAFSSFDRKVAMTIAVVAAALAGVSVLGHRAHNDVLRLQNEAAVKEVNSSNGYAWYQSTRGRQQALQLSKQMVTLQPMPTGAADQQKRAEMLKGWDKKIAEYDGDLKKRRELAETAKKEAAVLAAESHFIHRQADRLDVGHLAVELGLVLASIAVLTKRKEFWLAGIASSVIGLAVTISTYAMQNEHPAESHAAVEHKDEKPKGESTH